MGAYGLGFTGWGLGFRVWGLGFIRVYRLVLRVYDLPRIRGTFFGCPRNTVCGIWESTLGSPCLM